MPPVRATISASVSRDAAASGRLEEWFGRKGWEAFGFQRETWAAYLAGTSGLVHAPTGIGKTLAVWGGPLLEGVAEGEEARGERTALRVLWITPLRALAADTLQALREPVEGLGLGWAIEARTGDTSPSQKARQKARLPAALVTTPESLSLLLTYPETRERMATLRAVIVDEWHELLGTKRGVQTELCLARLRAWRPDLKIWGLSATIGNLEEAKAVLLGPDGVARGAVVSGKTPKRVEIETLIPEEPGRFPWSGHLGTRMLEAVIGRIEGAGTTLLFTNTRSQTEIWHQALVDARPEWGETLAMHHGSLEREIREEVEARLRAGTVRCVVCTSSLDLGVDFSPVEQVLQLGSPKGVARLMQRAGRSGHQPGATSRVIGVPTNAFELVEFAAAREAMDAGRIESRVPMEGALDVLAQHLVTVAIGGGFTEEAMRAEARSTHAFRELTDEEWGWVLEFVTSGGPALRAYPDYKKVAADEAGVFRVEDRRMAQLHRMNIGTISSSMAVAVRMTNGKRLGTVEEGFISRMKVGDQFVFAGRRLELVRFREMTAEVRPPTKKKKGNLVPKWGGGKSPLSTELAETVLAKMAEPDGPESGPEMRAAREILDIQSTWSRLPRAGELLVESTETDEGRHFFLYPFAGRLVHEGLAALCAFRLSRAEGVTVHTSFNDYGFSLLAEEACSSICWSA
jgi:ATP-dependent Lhr-like helicase